MPNSNSIIKAISKRLLKRRLFYVCRDIERAAGLLDLSRFSVAENRGSSISPPKAKSGRNYRIITNYNAFSAKLARQYPRNIILIKEKEQSRRKVGIPTVASGLLDTIDLLKHPTTKKTIKRNDFVLVFKNNTLIETACRKNGWKLLNPDSKLADEIEGKVSQVKWLGNLTKYLPPYRLDVCGNIKWTGRPFILQFNHSHTGSGTLLIDTAKKLNDLKLKFPRREIRTSRFIAGPVFTNNNAVWGDKILTGNISYQITGLPPFTDNKFATIGNDWALPHKLLTHKQIKKYEWIATEVGKKLNKDGWKGLYGIDIITDEKTGRFYLLEINARQPASTTFESVLQAISYKLQATNITTFEAHLASLLDLPNKGYKLISINDGAQIIQRVTDKIKKARMPKIPQNALINAIKYNNTLPGSDLVRWQFNKGLMAKHNTLNALGKKIR